MGITDTHTFTGARAPIDRSATHWQDIMYSATRLSAAHVVDTAAVLKNNFLHVSPAAGLLATSANTFLANVHNLHGVAQQLPPPWAAAAALARDLYLEPRPGAPLQATKSRSHAGAHLDGGALGHILGLALADAGDQTIGRTLREQCGIETNKVHGEWTGVSMARYRRLVEHLGTGRDDAGPVIPLYLRFVWHRAKTKRGLLDFLLALDSHTACLVPAWREAVTTDPAAAEGWCRSQFTPSDTNEASVEAAARRILQPPSPEPSPSPPLPPLRPSSPPPAAELSFARALEILAANLSDVHAFKPPNVLERHAYRGGAPRPDCVEMLLRETLDLLLYSSESRTFEVEARLPSGASGAVRAHYERRAAGELSDADAGADWFPLAQGLAGCKYISAAPNGDPYELHPSLSNLAGAAGVLLGQPGWRSLSALQAYWNAHAVSARAAAADSDAAELPRKLVVDESRSGAYRPLLSDSPRSREIAKLMAEGSRFSVEFLLEVDPPIALATHGREDAPWAEATKRAHLDAWRGSEAAAGVEAEAAARSQLQVLRHALWPVVLGDRLLDELPDHPTAASSGAASSGSGALAASAVLAARWPRTAEEVEGQWSPAVEASTVELAHATMREAARQRSHARAASALAALAASDPTASHPTVDSVPSLAGALLPWLLDRVPAALPSARVATALLDCSSLSRVAACERGLSRREDGAALVALIRFSRGEATWAEALSAAAKASSGPVEALRLLWAASRPKPRTY